MSAVSPPESPAPRVFLLPDLGEGLTSAEVVTWLVAEGDEVHVDQPVAEVETAKAAVEVPVPFAGRVATLHAAAGQTIAVGAPLISVQTDEADRNDAASAPATGSGNVLVGYGTSEPARRARRRPEPVPTLAEPGVITPEPVTPEPVPAPSPGTVPVPAPSPGAEPATRVPRGVVSPLVRRLAAEQGLNLDAIEGDGVITRADVETAAARPAAVPAPAPAVVPAPAPAAGGTRVPFTPTHRAMAETLSRSRREIPEATVWVDVDATDLLAARRRLNAGHNAGSGATVSVLALVARFCVLGLQRFPALNGRVEADAVVLHDAVHLGIAAQTDRGLSVPVLRDADRLGLDATAAALRELTDRARAGSLAPADLTGGTFTLNNYGPFGVDGSAAIINPPQVAILGLGRIVERPWVLDGQLAVRQVTELTLAFDHRACDGGTAGGFLRFVADCIENPLRAL